jgi:hypothetical protein
VESSDSSNDLSLVQGKNKASLLNFKAVQVFFVVTLGGLVVSMLAMGYNVCFFRPSLG